MPGGRPTGSPRGQSEDPSPRDGTHPPSSSALPRSRPLAAINANFNRNDGNGSNGTANDRYIATTNGESGIELASDPWGRRCSGHVGEDWASKEGIGDSAMGGALGGTRKASAPGWGAYEVVEREEPLLNDDEPPVKVVNDESISAGLLWSARDGPSLSSGGDHSLGPAFRRHRAPSNECIGSGHRSVHASEDREPLSPTPTEWALSAGGSSVRRVGSRANRGRCTLSGRPLVYLCALCSSLCSILLGYDVGVVSGAKEFMKPDLGLTSNQVEIAVGALNLVAAFGGLLAGSVADRLGRKPTIALACAVFIVGAAVMSASHSFGLLLFGRIVTGVGVGGAMVIAPVYITELAPPDIRGMLVSLTDICINLGIVLGFGSTLMCMDVFESDSARWRAMIGIGTVPPMMILMCLFMMPESPRWLIAKKHDLAALEVLQRVLDDDVAAEENLRSISQATVSNEEATWKDVLMPTDKAVKAAMLLGVGLGFFQQASGSEAAVYYTPDVLQDHGWNQTKVMKGNIGVGVFKLAGELVAFFLLDRIGRRPLFLASSTLVTVCLVMVGTAFAFNWVTSLVLFWLCMFMFTFSLGLGPVTFVVASEIFPVAIRGKAMSIVIFVNRLMSGIIASSFETLETWISKPHAFFFFGFLSFISISFYWYKVPETRGRTLEEIIKDLGSTSSPRSSADSNGDGASGGRHAPLQSSSDDEQE